MQARVADWLAMVVAAGAPSDVLADARQAVFIAGGGSCTRLIVIGYFMVSGQDQVAAVLDTGIGFSSVLSCARLGAEVTAKLERAAGQHAAFIARRFEILRFLIRFVHTPRCQLLAVAMQAEAIGAGVLIDFEGKQVALPVDRRRLNSLHSGILVVERCQSCLARTDAPYSGPLVNTVVLARAALVVERDHIRFFVDRLGQGAVVRDHQRMTVGSVLVPVVQP